MMNLSRFFSFFLFLINMTSVVYADKYYFEQISLNEGLSQSTVKTIYRDRTGMLWIGTKEGLNRYDGQSVHTYYHDTEQEHSLSGNNIFFYRGCFRGEIKYCTFSRRVNNSGRGVYNTGSTGIKITNNTFGNGGTTGYFVTSINDNSTNSYISANTVKRNAS